MATRSGEPEALVLDAQLAGELQPDPERFRDRRLLYLRPDELRAISVDGRAAPELRDRLLALRAERYEAAATVEPAHRITLDTARGAYTLALSPRSDEGCLGRLTGPEAPPVPFRLAPDACRVLAP
jgi:hypothetical protein